MSLTNFKDCVNVKNLNKKDQTKKFLKDESCLTCINSFLSYENKNDCEYYLIIKESTDEILPNNIISICEKYEQKK